MAAAKEAEVEFKAVVQLAASRDDLRRRLADTLRSRPGPARLLGLSLEDGSAARFADAATAAFLDQVRFDM